jgi:hypothetical protein
MSICFHRLDRATARGEFDDKIAHFEKEWLTVSVIVASSIRCAAADRRYRNPT